MADDPEVPSLVDIVDAESLGLDFSSHAHNTQHSHSTNLPAVTQHSMLHPKMTIAEHPENVDEMKRLIENLNPEEKEAMYKNVKKMAKKGELVQHVLSTVQSQVRNSISSHISESTLPSNPLIEATQKGDFEEVKRILENDEAPVDSRDQEGNTALHWAVYSSFKPVYYEIFEYLVQKGANIDWENNTENHSVLDWAVIAGNDRVVSRLLKLGADLLHKDKRGYNALHHAAQYNHPLLTYYLVKYGIPTDSLDTQGHTALHWAAYSAFDDIIRLLIRLGAQINKQDNQGYTPLHWAAIKGNVSAVHLLLDEGADSRILDFSGNSAAFAAQKKGYFKLVSSLNKKANFYQLYRTTTGRSTQNILWFGLGCLLFLYISFLAATFPLWITLPAFGLAFYLGYFFLSPRWPGTTRPNKFWMGLYVGNFLVSINCYMLSIFSWHIEYHYFESLTFISLFLVVCSLFISLIYKNPGVIKSSPENNLESLSHKLHNGEAVPEICTTCMMAKPLRSRHCTTWNRCVARYDRMYYWIDSSIGLKNYNLFIVFVLLSVVLDILFVAISFSYISDSFGENESLPAWWKIFSLIFLFYRKAPLPFFVGLLHLCKFLLDLSTLNSIVVTLKNNLTFVELNNKKKISYLKGNAKGSTFNPFDHHSFIDNAMEILMPKVDYKSFFFIPQEV